MAPLLLVAALLLSLMTGCASSDSVPHGLVYSFGGVVSGVSVEEIGCEAKAGSRPIKTITDAGGCFIARPKWIGRPAWISLKKAGYFDAVCSLDGKNSRYIMWPKDTESPKLERGRPDEYVDLLAGSSTSRINSTGYFTVLGVAFENRAALRESMIKNWGRLEQKYGLVLMLSIFGEREDFEFLRSATFETKRGKFVREKLLLNTLVNPATEQEWLLVENALAGIYGEEIQEQALINLRLSSSGEAARLLDRTGFKRDAKYVRREAGEKTNAATSLECVIASVSPKLLSGKTRPSTERFESFILSRTEKDVLFSCSYPDLQDAQPVFIGMKHDGKMWTLESRSFSGYIIR